MLSVVVPQASAVSVFLRIRQASGLREVVRFQALQLALVVLAPAILLLLAAAVLDVLGRKTPLSGRLRRRARKNAECAALRGTAA